MTDKEQIWPTFCCEYDFQGKRWCLNIVARDWADAEARCAALNLRLKGILVETVSASPLACLWAWFSATIYRLLGR
ncbi:MAG: hypothetical protein JST84_09390 [Acidobacteria bacterium]|nr:hypothetical protein [Acidobacteriota bacterium]